MNARRVKGDQRHAASWFKKGDVVVLLFRCLILEPVMERGSRLSLRRIVCTLRHGNTRLRATRTHRAVACVQRWHLVTKPKFQDLDLLAMFHRLETP